MESSAAAASAGEAASAESTASAEATSAESTASSEAAASAAETAAKGREMIVIVPAVVTVGIVALGVEKQEPGQP